MSRRVCQHGACDRDPIECQPKESPIVGYKPDWYCRMHAMEHGYCGVCGMCEGFTKGLCNACELDFEEELDDEERFEDDE